MPEIVPLSNDPSSTFTITLNANELNFQTKYNTRTESWSFDIYDTQLKPLVYGAPFLLGGNIVEPYTLGIGGFVPVDLTESSREATPSTIGLENILVYLTEDELETLRLSGGVLDE